MKISAAAASIVPINIELDLPDSTPPSEIRDKVIEQARTILANIGATHVVLASDIPDLVDGIAHLADLGFPVLTEFVPIEPPEPDLNELAEAGIARTLGRRREAEDLHLDGMPDWRD